MAASTMVNAVAPLRTGITRSTRPPILPLTQSSLSTFNTPRTQEQQFLATFPSPKRPSPRTPPARTPYRHSYDGSAATRERQVSATRRRSTSTFGGRDSSEGDSVADTPLLLSTSPKRRVLSVPTSPANAAETPRRTGHPGARGDAVLNVPARNSSSTAPLKPPRRVGTPILTGLDEGPKDERGVAVPDAASAESNRPAPSHDLNRRATHDAPRREAESFELQYALDQTMDLSDFEVQHPAQSSTGAQGQRPNPMPLSLMADVRLASEVPVTPASDERSSEISQSYRNARSLDLGSVTERVDLMTQIRGKASVSLAAQAEGAIPMSTGNRTHGQHLSLSSMTSIDASSAPRRSEGDSESVTSATSLLPAAPIGMPGRSMRPAPLDLALVAVPPGAWPRRLPQSLGSRSDLSPVRKAQLVRRTRKLERVLGEPLPQKHVEQFVVEPSLSTTTVMTKLEEGVWPATPTAGGIPEWARADVVPRYESLDTPEEEPESEPSSLPSQVQHLTHQRSRSGVALSRMRSLIGGRDTPPPARIVVNLTREVRTTETQVRSHPMMRHGGNREDNLPPTPDTPISAMTASTIETYEEASRRQRRLQLAKLQRLLGTYIPPYALRARDDDLVPRCTPQIPSAQRSASESTLSLQSSTSGVTNADTRPGRLAARLRHTVHVGLPGRGSIGPSGTVMVRDRAFDIVSSLSPPAQAFNDENTMTRSEKAVARKRASKLEQVFGRVPPQHMFLPVRARASVDLEGVIAESVVSDRNPSESPSDSALAYASAYAALSGTQGARHIDSHVHVDGTMSHHGHGESSYTYDDSTVHLSELMPSPSFTSYRDSIRSLIWLVENDQGRLANIVDEIAELDDARSSRSPIPIAGQSGRRASLSSIEGQFVQFSQFGHVARGLSNITTSPMLTAETAHARRSRSPKSPPTPKTNAPRSPRSPIAFFHSLSRATASLISPSTPEPTLPEVSAHQVARRCTRKLSSFFGERVDPAHAHVHAHNHHHAQHHHHVHSVPSAHPSHIHVPASSYQGHGQAGPSHGHLQGDGHAPHTSVFGYVAPSMAAPPRPAAARRRETFDGVLGELWRNIQAEAAQGRMRTAEFGNLREMWGRLGRQRAQSGAWAEL